MVGKVKVPPLALVATAAGAQRLLAEPAGRPGVLRAVAAGVLGVASVGFLASSVREFRRSQTTVNPTSPEQATSLVTSGPHRISRNPMYVGMAGLLSAHALSRGAWPGVVPVIAFVAVIDGVQIPEEEAALTAQFGRAYADYAAAVPRWLGVSGPAARRT